MLNSMKINENIKPSGLRSEVFDHGASKGGGEATWTLKTLKSLKSLNTWAPQAILRGSGANLTTRIDSVREWRHPHATLSHRMITLCS